MKDNEALIEQVRDAAAAFNKTMLGINAGGLLLLGSLLNSLLTAEHRDSVLIFTVAFLMYFGITGVLFALTSQFRELKLYVSRAVGSNRESSNEAYRRSSSVYWLTVAFAGVSYLAIAIKVMFS